MSQDVLPLVIKIYKGTTLVMVKQFTGAQVVFGRGGSAQVILDDPSVSVLHASIDRRGADCFVSDLGSDEGTLVNGQPVLEAQINTGDQIQIGLFRIDFSIGVPQPKSESSAAQASGPVPSAAPAIPAVAPVTPAVAPIVAPSVEIPSLTPPAPAAAPKAVTPPPAPLTPAAAPPVAPKPATPPVAPKPVTPPPAPLTPAVASKPVTPPTAPVTPAAAPPVAPKAVTPPPAPVAPTVAPAASASRPNVPAAKPAQTSAGPVSSQRSGAHHAHHERHGKKHQRFGRTFAPPSAYQDVKDVVRPSKGTVVEVAVAWKERIVSSHHFSTKGTFTLGSHPDCDVLIPFPSSQRKVPFLKIDARAVVYVLPQATGELLQANQSVSFADLMRQSRMITQGGQQAIALEQGEMLKMNLGDSVSILIRYVADTPKPLAAPILDLTASEAVAIVMALAMSVVIGLYTYLYTPPKTLGEEKNDEPQRLALILIKPPPPKAPPPPPPEPIVAPTPPPVVVKSTPSPKKIEEPKAQPQQAKKDPGKASAVAPNKNKTGPKELTSVKKGGSIKTTDQAAAQMQSAKKDISKQGVFSVFGGGGAQKSISQEYSGVGELAGAANKATGRAGLNEDRAGEGLGSELKDTGRGGEGTSQIGVPGVKTSGRGSGDSGYGSGGLGSRVGSKIKTGGGEEAFSGTIDREAIRRVIQANLKAIRACYERELNRKPDLFGKVVIEWDIGSKGHVVRAHVKSTELTGAPVGECVVERLKTWTFPEPPSNNEVTVSYPFFFSN